MGYIILTNIHVIGVLLLIVSLLACGLSGMVVLLEDDQGDRRFAMTVFKYAGITLVAGVVLFIFTPSYSDVVLFKLKG